MQEYEDRKRRRVKYVRRKGSKKVKLLIPEEVIEDNQLFADLLGEPVESDQTLISKETAL